MSTIEELLKRTSSGSGREYVRKDPSRWPRSNIYPQKPALNSPTSGGRSVGIVRSRTQATEFLLLSACGWVRPYARINYARWKTCWTISPCYYHTSCGKKASEFRTQGAQRLSNPNCYGIEFLAALFQDMRGMMVLLTYCVLPDESFNKWASRGSTLSQQRASDPLSAGNRK
jgi:hypothetical protein